MKLLSAISTLLLLKEATSQTVSCPNSIDLGAWTEVELEDELLFKYAVVLSPSPEQSIMCARLESTLESYIGFGISLDDDMEGQGIIGSPDIGVQKYNLSPGSVELMPAAKQTLMFTSITQSGGQTIMEFAKYLSEDGEIEIDPNGENFFLWAVGSSNALGYHADRDDFTVNIQTSPLTESITSTSSTTPQSTSTSTSSSASSTSSSSSISSSSTSSSTTSSSTSSSTTSSTSSETSTSSSQASSSSSPATAQAISSTDSVCLTEEDCREASEEAGLFPFFVGPYRTKGCFTKNGKAFFSLGTEEKMSTDTLSGDKERVYCGTVQATSSSSTSTSSSSAPVQIDSIEEATSDTICLTEEDCAAAADDLGMALTVGSFSTKGCFSKKNMVFWSEGPEADMASDDLPGIRERVYCGGETETAGTEPAKAASSVLVSFSSPSSTSTTTTTTSEDTKSIKITKSSIGDSSKSIQQAQAAIGEYSGATMKTKASVAVGILMLVAPLMF